MNFNLSWTDTDDKKPEVGQTVLGARVLSTGEMTFHTLKCGYDPQYKIFLWLESGMSVQQPEFWAGIEGPEYDFGDYFEVYGSSGAQFRRRPPEEKNMRKQSRNPKVALKELKDDKKKTPEK